MAKLMLPAELEVRAGDEWLSVDLLRLVSVFEGVQPAQIERFPRAVILRKYEPGEMICRQGEAGRTAYYILTSEDMLKVRRRQGTLQNELKERDSRLAQLSSEKKQEEAVEIRGRLAELQQRIDAKQSLLKLLRDSAGRPNPKEIESLRRHDDRIAFADLADKQLAVRRSDTDKLSSEEKKLRAKEIESEDRDLASLLLTSAARPEPAAVKEIEALRKKLLAAEAADAALAEQDNELPQLTLEDKHHRVAATEKALQALTDEKDGLQELHNLLCCSGSTANISAEIESLEKRVEQYEASSDRALRSRATVRLSVPRLEGGDQPARGFWQGLRQSLFQPERRPERQPTYIPIDGPVVLADTNPIAELYEGELLGEMCCMNPGDPRSATVEATQECYVIEMLRNILELLQKSAPFKEQMEKTYRERVLSRHLQSLSFFSDLKEDALDKVSQCVELVRYRPTDVIIEQGAESDCLFVVRTGLVKVIRKEGAAGHEREHIVAYRGRGESLGEMGLITGATRSAQCVAFRNPDDVHIDKKKLPECVELIKLAKANFERLCSEIPELMEAANRSKQRYEKADKTEALMQIAPIPKLPRFAELGLFQGKKLMLIDLDRCTRCDECVRACASTHGGQARLFREGPRFGKYLIPSTCRQCLDPVCMIGCPVGAIHKSNEGHIVIRNWCIGCEKCATQCPYDAINMHELNPPKATGDSLSESISVTQQAVVCDQCNSHWGEAMCVYACPHDAAKRVDARRFFAEESAFVSPPDSNAGEAP